MIHLWFHGFSILLLAYESRSAHLRFDLPTASTKPVRLSPLQLRLGYRNSPAPWVLRVLARAYLFTRVFCHIEV